MRPTKYRIHPGENQLDEFLKPKGDPQAAFASRIRWTRARLNEIIRGTGGIIADAAQDLAQTVGTSSKLWMNLQGTWDLDQAKRRRRSAA